MVASPIQLATTTSKTNDVGFGNIKPAKGFNTAVQGASALPFSTQHPLLTAFTQTEEPAESLDGSMTFLPEHGLESTDPTLMMGLPANNASIQNAPVSSLTLPRAIGMGSATDTPFVQTPSTQPIARNTGEALSLLTTQQTSTDALSTSPAPVTTKVSDALNALLTTQPSVITNITAASGVSASQQAQHVQPALTTLSQPTTEWAPIRVDTQGGKWGEQMMQVLQDRVSFQAQQNLQEARIRLDPPELGKLDVIVRVEGDRLNVQLNASAVATREALVQLSERLRAELQTDHFVHVDVNVGAEHHQKKQHDDDDEHGSIYAARDVQSDNDTHAFSSEHWLNVHA
ncbi:flagellar hook-length control protein FliK [Enterovibrio coralii]|uniref:Flagellar hook-length control protein-like C-terminal domain-containing protein n=1 Tax=Enterovibrio coralii TaxID=294935 RepID=A0A135I6K5_9GAMM|nr:flagellar hook-length control protein FliK [Enterovibrio coralii]KXF81078.1 hypothetical protein ATN88_19120 [Enterovibrio coralii]